MRCLFGYLVIFVAVSLSIASNETAYAANNSAWFQNDIDQAVTTYSDNQQRGQCHGESVLIYNYATENLSPSYICLADTGWGSMSRSGYIGVTGTSVYYQVSLPDNATVLFTPQSSRLYIAHQEQSGYIRVGYANSPTALSFNTLTKIYNQPAIISYTPGSYSFVRFSNDTGYLIGITNTGALQRVSLRDSSVATPALPSSINPAGLRDLAISNDGSLVLARDEENSLILLDFEACVEHGVDACQLRVLGDADELLDFGDFVENLFIQDDSRGVSVFTTPRQGNLTEVSFTPHTETRYVSYAALGDSYSAGEGTWSYLPGTDGDGEYTQEKCHQGYVSYATEYYDQFRAIFDRSAFGSSSQGMRIGTYVMAACSGAKTEHVWQSTQAGRDAYDGQYRQLGNDGLEALRQYAVENQIPGRALQRDFLAYYQPDIATIGIGGNDIDFAGTIKACLSFTTCPQASSKRAESGKLIQGKFDTLVATFEDLHSASPSTRLYAVGYPLFVADDSWFCGVNTVLDKTERTFIRESIRYLNDVIEAAAKKAGIGYIDIENSLGNGVLCGSGTSAVNGISLGNDIAVPGTNIKVAGQESFHPNSHGYELEVGVLLDEYGELDTYPNYNCLEVESGYCPNSEVVALVAPSYFGTSNKSVVDTNNMANSLTTTRLLKLFIGGLRPASLLSGNIFSEQRSLGTFTVGPDGTFDRTIQLPEGLEPGYHTIYFSGTLENGESFEYSQTILYLPPDTKTGPCGILPYSNIDQDADGIDDACDPSIDVDNPITVEDSNTILIYPNPFAATTTKAANDGATSNGDAVGGAPSNGGESVDTESTEVQTKPNTEFGQEEELFSESDPNISEQAGIHRQSLLPWLAVIGVIAICIAGLTYNKLRKKT